MANDQVVDSAISQKLFWLRLIRPLLSRGRAKPVTLALFLIALCAAQAELRVPAFTAYLDPDPDGARVSLQSGLSDWTDPSLKVLWFGEIKTPGKLGCSLLLGLPAGAESKLRLTV